METYDPLGADFPMLLLCSGFTCAVLVLMFMLMSFFHMHVVHVVVDTGGMISIQQFLLIALPCTMITPR
jgi:hypothetical protein